MAGRASTLHPLLSETGIIHTSIQHIIICGQFRHKFVQAYSSENVRLKV